MRIKLFEEFNQAGGEKIALELLSHAYSGKPGVEWVEPLYKGKLSFDEDKTDDNNLLFDIGERSVAIDFSWTLHVEHGRRGDGRNTPDDPDESWITDINIDKVAISEDGTEEAAFTDGNVTDAAWLLLYKLLPHDGSGNVIRQAKKLKEKLNWK